MKIAEALPAKKFAAALHHSQTPAWKAKRDEAIINLKTWLVDPRLERGRLPVVMFSYGKDSSAIAILMKAAKLEFEAFHILNGGDFPTHESIFPEFDAWYGQFNMNRRETSERYVDTLFDLVLWGEEHVGEHDGQPISFWNLGPLEDQLYWLTADRFMLEYPSDTLFISGKRCSEQMQRYYEVQRNGPFYRDGEGGYHWWYAYPLHNWRDIDVWALLVTEDCPVSPVYSWHRIPQKGGKQAFPRTYWYPEPILMNGNFYRWLAHYCPAQLAEMDRRFPEIRERLVKG